MDLDALPIIDIIDYFGITLIVMDEHGWEESESPLWLLKELVVNKDTWTPFAWTVFSCEWLSINATPL